MDVLVFQLTGPLSSWGELAPNTQRLSGRSPSMSAVLGILASSLGIARTDVEGLHAVHTGYSMMIESWSDGQGMIDFQTSEHGSGGKRIPTCRKEELAMPSLNTLPTYREYRTNGYWRAAITAKEGARWTLYELSAALREPHWAPYLGRRSCPLMLPMNPLVFHAATPQEALRNNPPDTLFWNPQLMQALIGKSSPRSLRWTEGELDGLGPQRIVTRRDDPSPRAPRGYLTRRECYQEVT